MANPIRSWILVIRLSLADLWYDKKVSFCIIASIISVVTPLLLLFSLKYGVVSELRNQLLNDPQNLEVKMVGNLQLDATKFAWLKEQPEVDFVIPLTRSLNTQADLMRDSSHFVNSAEVLPTAEGDPLTKKLPPLVDQNQIYITALAAEKMGVAMGDKIKMVLTRKLDGNFEKGMAELTVNGIIPEIDYSRAAAFVPLNLLIAMEAFYDGYRSDRFSITTGSSNQPEKTIFARARIYAKSLDDVAPLALKLRQQHIETRTQANAINSMKAVDNLLNFIFIVIAITSLFGCILSLIGAFLSNIERKRRDIAFMRLLGFKSMGIMLYLIVQSLLLSSLAFIISTLLYLIGNSVFNTVLGRYFLSSAVDSKQQFVSQLQGYHLLIAFLLTLLISGFVVLLGGRRAVNIQPAESLREL
ncbi:FtsX-like permease family protein [Orbaceae bacterium ESL0721]|nr:FtsX-like permease family protein [Orbaceae bacterium ESL0721]